MKLEFKHSWAKWLRIYALIIGGGVGVVTMLANAPLNFGLIGAIIIFFLWGMVLAFLYTWVCLPYRRFIVTDEYIDCFTRKGRCDRYLWRNTTRMVFRFGSVFWAPILILYQQGKPSCAVLCYITFTEYKFLLRALYQITQANPTLNIRWDIPDRIRKKWLNQV